MINPRAPGRRHLERLRQLTGGVLGPAPGSVPVSASRNGGYTPSVIPVVETLPVRAPRQGEIPTGGAGSFPTFSWPGPVTYIDLSTPWPVTADMDLANFIITQADGSDVLDIDVLVNGSVVDTVTTAATRTQSLAITVSVVVGDDIQLDLTDFGGSAAVNLGVVLTT